MSEEYIEYDYEDLCPECDKHDVCHKNEIDYDAIEKCCKELNEQVGYKEPRKPKEPKEKVCFT